MASIKTDKSGNQLISFRYGERQFTKSANTTDKQVAASTLALVNETIRRLKHGFDSLPVGADVGEYIISGGKRTGKAKVEVVETVKALTLAELFDRYNAEFPAGAKEKSTLSTERIHKDHLLRVLKPSTKLDSLKHNSFQNYANIRSGEVKRGQRIQPPTILKELQTLRMIWNWAKLQEHINIPLPYRLKEINFARTAEKAPFQTHKAITDAIKRGGLSVVEQKRLWKSLYLTLDEVHDVLNHVKAETEHRPYVYVMFVVAAMTGARRSEICRSKVDDWNLNPDAMTVNIRENKRKRGRASFRVIEVNTYLANVIKEWIAVHPGGQYLITKTGSDKELIWSTAHDEFKAALKDHKQWVHIPGFHTFRHSFASIMADAGVHEAIIDRFMGHQTAEQRERYRHLFPKNRQKATELLARPGT